METTSRDKEQLTVNRLEVWPEDKSFEKKMIQFLQDDLDEETIDQISFMLKHLILEDDFRNQCKEATKNFGMMFDKKFAPDEESLLELEPAIQYHDVKSEGRLDIANYQGNYHSVGVMGTTSKKDNSPMSIVIDFTYFNINKKWGDSQKMLFLKIKGGLEEVCQELQNQYRGKWSADLTLIQHDDQISMRYIG